MQSDSSTPSLGPVNFTTGLSDGLLLPFAACILLVPILGGHRFGVALAGMALSLPGALAFGLARFLGEREEIAHRHPVLSATEAEKETGQMEAIGIDPGLTADMQVQMKAEREQWLEEVRENKLGWERPDRRRALHAGLQTAAGFFSGGIVTSLLFAGVRDNDLSLLPALLGCPLLCFVLGWYKGRLVGGNALRYGLYHAVRSLTLAAAAGGLVWLLLAGGSSLAQVP